jgi:hypothetical protein
MTGAVRVLANVTQVRSPRRLGDNRALPLKRAVPHPTVRPSSASPACKPACAQRTSVSQCAPPMNHQLAEYSSSVSGPQFPHIVIRLVDTMLLLEQESDLDDIARVKDRSVEWFSPWRRRIPVQRRRFEGWFCIDVNTLCYRGQPS